MSPVRFATPSTFRGRWRGVVVLAVLIGVAGGAVLSAWEGARRTESTLTRMLRETRQADVSVGINGDIRELSHYRDFSALAKVPGVARAGARSTDLVSRRGTTTPSSRRTSGRTRSRPATMRSVALSTRRSCSQAASRPSTGPTRLWSTTRHSRSCVRKGLRRGSALGFRWPGSGSPCSTKSAARWVTAGRHRRRSTRSFTCSRPGSSVASGSRPMSSRTRTRRIRRCFSGPSSVGFTRRMRATATESLVLRNPEDLQGVERATRARYPNAGIRFSTPGDLERAFACEYAALRRRDAAVRTGRGAGDRTRTRAGARTPGTRRGRRHDHAALARDVAAPAHAGRRRARRGHRVARRAHRTAVAAIACLGSVPYRSGPRRGTAPRSTRRLVGAPRRFGGDACRAPRGGRDRERTSGACC